MARNDRGNNRRGYNNKQEGEKLIITATYKVKYSAELLTFLLEKMNTSRNNVKSLLSNHQVLVNGNVVTQFNFLLGREDEIKISKNYVKTADQVENNKKKAEAERRKRAPRIEIIYEDDDFIAIDKPAGLLSVESDKERESAYMYVSQYLAQTSKTARCYVVHRIDKETSGVLMFAKNPKAHSILRLNWNDYVVKREYYAVVEGKMPKKSDTITTYLKENQNNLVYVTEDRRGDKAITHYKVVSENDQYSLLRVQIDTGRKNQIRVHMASLGHPIVFDEKYGYNLNPLKRLGLHASVLEIKNPLNEEEIMHFEAKIPSVFRGLFKKEK